MSTLDWIILVIALSGIIGYGLLKSKSSRSIEGYFLDDRSMPWLLVLLGIMGTQASAITYLTGPGQAYTDGMRFVQYYFGLPFAMIVIAFVFVPVYQKMNVVTAYEFIEHRFDGKTRALTSFLFLLSRGLSTGISIYAPSLILSSLMGWNIYITNVVMGGLVIIYTMTGGARAVAYTQTLQMSIIFISLFIIVFLVIKMLPDGESLSSVLSTASQYGKLNIITTGQTDNGFDWKDKYNIFSGLIGGFFLALSYFGTDHSQVGRYISAKNVQEGKKGLLLNGLVKIPMQIFILFIGVLIFVFYLHAKAPVYFDSSKVNMVTETERSHLSEIETKYQLALQAKDLSAADSLRANYKAFLKKALPAEDTNDTNFIFLRFVKDNLPMGLIGLLFAVIFLAAWGSIAGALNSLAACSVVDFHKKYIGKDASKVNDYKVSQWYTFGWGIFCIVVAMFAYNIGNSLIEAVNILGSLFYGVILGIFIVAFWIKNVGGTAVFASAILSEVLVIMVYNSNIISFLWLNVIGAVFVVVFALVFQGVLKNKSS